MGPVPDALHYRAGLVPVVYRLPAWIFNTLKHDHTIYHSRVDHRLCIGEHCLQADTLRKEARRPLRGLRFQLRGLLDSRIEGPKTVT